MSQEERYVRGISFVGEYSKISHSTHYPVVDLCVSYYVLQEDFLMNAQQYIDMWVQLYVIRIFFTAMFT